MSDTNIDLGVTVKDGIKGVSKTPEKECGGKLCAMKVIESIKIRGTVSKGYQKNA